MINLQKACENILKIAGHVTAPDVNLYLGLEICEVGLVLARRPLAR